MRATPFVEAPVVQYWREALFPQPRGMTAHGIFAALRDPQALAGLRQEVAGTILVDFSGDGQRPEATRRTDQEFLKSPFLIRMLLEGKLRFGITPLIEMRNPPRTEELITELLETADPYGQISPLERHGLRRDLEIVLSGRWGAFVPVLASLFRMGVRGAVELGRLDSAGIFYLRWGDMVIVDQLLSLAEAILVLERIGGDRLSCLFIRPLRDLRGIPASRLSDASLSGRLSETILFGLRFSGITQRHAASMIAAASLPA